MMTLKIVAVQRKQKTLNEISDRQTDQSTLKSDIGFALAREQLRMFFRQLKNFNKQTTLI